MNDSLNSNPLDHGPPINFSICVDAENSLKRNMCMVLVNLFLSSFCLISIGILIINYFRVRIVFHGNLLVLFGNIIFLGFINSISYFALYLRHTLRYLLYQDPCDLVNYFWPNVILLTPSYVYYFAYPAFHFCVMVERARATYLAEKYEGYGRRLGWHMTFWIWLGSIALMAVCLYLAYLDPLVFATPLPIVTLTSSYNSEPIIVFYILCIPLAIFTACFDWRITAINNQNRALSKHFHDYSLSRNYQLNENTLAMRLILPLDIFYAVLYTMFTALTCIVRLYKNNINITLADYIFYYYVVNVLNYLYTIVTTIVYIRFIKFIGQKRKNVYTPQNSLEHTKIHFKQLNAQWQ